MIIKSCFSYKYMYYKYYQYFSHMIISPMQHSSFTAVIIWPLNTENTKTCLQTLTMLQKISLAHSIWVRLRSARVLQLWQYFPHKSQRVTSSSPIAQLLWLGNQYCIQRRTWLHQHWSIGRGTKYPPRLQLILCSRICHCWFFSFLFLIHEAFWTNQR